MNDNRAYVKFTADSRGINISWSYTTYYKPVGDSRFTCYIPAFDIHYHTTSAEKIHSKGKTMTHMFIDHYIDYVGKGKLRSLALRLHKLGFKAPNDLHVLSQLMHGKVLSTNFSAKGIIPAEYVDAEAVESGEMEVNI